MSSIMPCRSGLMGFSLIGVLLVFEVEVEQPLDPQDRALPIRYSGSPRAPPVVVTTCRRLARSAFVPWHM